MTNTPSPEEVAKAQEWLRDCPGDWAIGELADVYAQPVAELLASYAAEQGRRYEITETLTKAEFDKRFVVVHQCPAGDADCRCAEVQHQFSDKQTLDYYEESERLRKELQAAESRLTSLREGLRRLIAECETYMTERDGDESGEVEWRMMQEITAAKALLAEKKE